MFVALPFRSQVANPVLVVGSKAAPLPFTRQSALSDAKSAAVSSAWPFLLLQKPGVRPPQPPSLTFPNLTVVGQPSVTDCVLAVMAIEPAGTISVTV